MRIIDQYGVGIKTGMFKVVYIDDTLSRQLFHVQNISDGEYAGRFQLCRGVLLGDYPMTVLYKIVMIRYQCTTVQIVNVNKVYVLIPPN